MKDFMSLSRGLVLAGSTLVLGSALAVSSNISSTQAAAITFTGKANISKFAGTASTNELISFTGPFETQSSSGLFKNLVANSVASISLIPLDLSLSSYIANAPNVPFISFTDGSRFEITNPFEITKYRNGNSFEISSFFEGKYINDSEELYKVGLFTINEINNTSGEGNFSLTLTNICCSPTPTPESTSTSAFTVFGLASLAFSQKIIRIRKK
ncbi:unknown protein [Nostoc sp. NIES-3756]|uniref:hypothetical protein n=1 Tax=Nostoc sp. NIES-3756 TaxID=1751286 RepID=UPI0007210D0C|nr:hypothetical protein [Nostoc sp. NIES-3756]BAT56331.1 unknown protein [Nostoc sp. NIES-3756]